MARERRVATFRSHQAVQQTQTLFFSLTGQVQPNVGHLMTCVRY